MRIVRLTYSTLAAGVTAPIEVNYTQPTFNVTLGVIPSAAATGLSCKAQYTLDDQTVWRYVNWTQAAQVVTITDGLQTFGDSSANPGNPHGLITGDTITIRGSGTGTPLPFTSFDGTYPVTVTNPTTYTITVTPSQTASGASQVIPQRWADTTIIPAATATRLYNNTTQPATAFRFVIAALTAGSVDFILLQGLGT